MKTILITSIGGSGSNSLVETLQLMDDQFRVVGTHGNRFELAKARIPDIYLVPKASQEEAYFSAHQEIIERYKIDFLIANSDKEVTAIAPRVAELSCAHLVPPAAVVNAVQDKFHFHQMLKAGGCRVVENITINDWSDIESAAKEVGEPSRFWVRPRIGSGSFGATWVESAEQARKWIELYVEMRGLDVKQFVFAPFLPGRDFSVSVLWQNGEVVVGKAVERLTYFFGDLSLSGMGSTPGVTCSGNTEEPITAMIEAITAVYAGFDAVPHGYFNGDVKYAADGAPIVTEINIGRFPMINAHFDRVGKWNMLELYLRMGLDPSAKLPRGEFDIAPGTFVVRGVDTPPVFVTEDALMKVPSIGVEE